MEHGEAPGPLDADDPRFGGDAPAPPRRKRELVRTRGPGPSPEEPRVRVLRIAVPAIAVLGLVAVGAVFFRGLASGPGTWEVGPVEAVRAAVAERPRRVCYQDANPCAWLTVFDGRLLALSTNGPQPQEFGRQGIGWCPSSGYFGSNALGTRYDPAGRIVSGPALRSLDRFDVSTSTDGAVVINFAALTAGLPRAQVLVTVPAAGPDCAEIPFDHAPDLAIPDPATP